MGDGDGDGDGERLRACSCRDGQRNGGRLATEELRVPALSNVILDSDRKILLDGFDLTCCNVLKLPLLLLLLLVSIKLDSNKQRAFLTVSGLGNSSSTTSLLVGMIFVGDCVRSSTPTTCFSSSTTISCGLTFLLCELLMTTETATGGLVKIDEHLSQRIQSCSPTCVV